MAVMLATLVLVILVAALLHGSDHAFTSSRDITIIRADPRPSGCGLLLMFILGVLFALVAFGLLAQG